MMIVDIRNTLPLRLIMINTFKYKINYKKIDEEKNT